MLKQYKETFYYHLDDVVKRKQVYTYIFYLSALRLTKNINLVILMTFFVGNLESDIQILIKVYWFQFTISVIEIVYIRIRQMTVHFFVNIANTSHRPNYHSSILFTTLAINSIKATSSHFICVTK